MLSELPCDSVCCTSSGESLQAVHQPEECLLTKILKH